MSRKDVGDKVILTLSSDEIERELANLEDLEVILLSKLTDAQDRNELRQTFDVAKTAMSDEYIKREDAINTVRNTFTGMTADTLELRINGIPSADVAPVRHGQWTEISYDEYQCSVCQKVVREEILYAIKPGDREDASMHVANYCPMCGAKMNEEEVNE